MTSTQKPPQFVRDTTETEQEVTEIAETVATLFPSRPQQSSPRSPARGFPPSGDGSYIGWDSYFRVLLCGESRRMLGVLILCREKTKPTETLSVASADSCSTLHQPF